MFTHAHMREQKTKTNSITPRQKKKKKARHVIWGQRIILFPVQRMDVAIFLQHETRGIHQAHVFTK